MKALSVAGTAAMFLVGGGILTHGLPWLHHGAEAFAARAGAVPALGGAFALLAPSLVDALVGVAAGALVLLGVSAVSKWRGRA
jgi:predicted DNA repair protein MutK